MKLTVSTRLWPTEEKEKVLKALENIFPNLEFSEKDDAISASGSEQNDLAALKEYLISIASGDNEEGCHIVEIVEDTDSTFQMNIEYCAWYEIYQKLGIKEACLLSCNSDDILLPQYLKPLNVEFKRKGTISKGDEYCDFRFVKSSNG